ncbi:hypothetical protein Sjap_020761 [Stephania japonica]|uniref:Cytochrome P450 n=1 Tax=Stephania japonica TaxID=461633 RepID=A0AAP0F429_9MAGN
MKSTMDSIFKVAFGVELDSICRSSVEGTTFANAFDDSSTVTPRRYVDVSWKIKRWLNIGAEAKLKKNIQVIDAFVQELINRKIEQASSSKLDDRDNDNSHMKKDNAEKYRPERWLNDDEVFQSVSPFKFPVFQAGPRICLEKEFSYRQMKIFSAVLLGCFTFKLSDEKRSVNYRTMINIRIDGGLHLHAFPRS